jgi:hypothetical protein
MHQWTNLEEMFYTRSARHLCDAPIEELLEAVFSVGSTLRRYTRNERMLHKGYDRKESVRKKIVVVSLKGLGAKTN